MKRKKPTSADAQPEFGFNSVDDAPGAHFRLWGRLDSATTAHVWEDTLGKVLSADADTITIDASDLEYCDSAGVALLAEMHCVAEENGRSLDITDLDEHVRHMLQDIDFASLEQERTTSEEVVLAPEELGKAVYGVWADLRELVAFVGQALDALGRSLRHPFSVRWRQTFYVAEVAGANTLPIVLLIGFIIGLVMAFQAAMPMREFAADIYVTDLVVLSMLRELGPLMTAIILAGRSGSAFAAEIGTMRINEEIDALTTMGIDPVRFLVVPKILAAVMITPLLTLYANVIGIIGGGIVLVSLGHPIVAYWNRVVYVSTFAHFGTGMLKSIVFGFLVAWVGCLRGLQTRTGASGVGKSTTSAVVSAIVLIAIFDALFSITFYILDI